MTMRIIPNDSVELAEKLLIMSRDKLTKALINDPDNMDIDEAKKLIMQTLSVLNTTDNG
jgi:hypothetical protein